MRIIGIGTDIVHVPRIDAVRTRHKDSFIRRILHPNEITAYQQHQQALAYLAKRFAVKEAVAKALGTGIGKSASFCDIETTHDALGKPVVHLHDDAKQTADNLGVTDIWVTLSDEKDYAIAYVILTGND